MVVVMAGNAKAALFLLVEISQRDPSILVEAEKEGG